MILYIQTKIVTMVSVNNMKMREMIDGMFSEKVVFLPTGKVGYIDTAHFYAHEENVK